MRSGIAVLAALALLGCATRSPTSESRAGAAQRAACQQSADSAFLEQNPGTVYQSDAFVSLNRASPFSAQGVRNDVSGGLPEQYSRAQLYDNCLNGIGPVSGPNPGALTPPPRVAPPEPPPP